MWGLAAAAVCNVLWDFLGRGNERSAEQSSGQANNAQRKQPWNTENIS